MRTAVIGNGLAGTIAAKTLRELDPQVEIVVFAQEKYPYYPRPNLISFLAGTMPYERVFGFAKDWHVRQKIDIRFGEPVLKILPGRRGVELSGRRREGCDALLIANGASSFVPPIKGADKRGVFTLRTLDDAQAILDYLKSSGRVAVVGGGLLGLEIARAVRARGPEAEVIEVFDRLLPRQLDAQAAAILRGQVEKLGIRVRLGASVEEFLGQAEVRGLRLAGGEEIVADMVVVAAGVVPNNALAQAAGLEVGRGLVVDDHLRTSHPSIFAAGDGVQHRGKVYGIIPASFDQGRAAAYNILEQDKRYEGTIPSHTLKVIGLSVTSVGLISPEGPGDEEIRKARPEEGIYKKIVLREGAIIGAIWLGTRKGVDEISRAVMARQKVSKWISMLLEDSFDFSVL